MRFLAGFALIFVSIAFIQGQLVIPQVNNLNALISLLPQFQGFLGQLDQILPQLSGILSSSELLALKDKITQVITSQLGGSLDINSIKDKLRPILQHFLGSKPQSRLDFDTILQQIVGAATSALPGIVLGLVGKREAVDARVNLNDIIALANKLQIQQFIPQITQFLSGDKLQQLQSQFFATIVAAAGNNWNLATVAQTIQQLVTQFVPQLGLMRIDWEQVGQQALNGVVGALPGILIGALSIFGKREAVDARVNLNDIIALANKFQIQQFIPQITQFLNGDKLQQLQNQFFATIIAAAGNNWDLSTIAQTIQQLVTQFVPQLGLMRIDWEQVGQQALNGVVNALPGILIGALSIFGKREAVDARVNLNDIVALANKFQIQQFIPQITQFLSGDKLQQLQSQFFATIVAAAGNNWNLATVAQTIQQLVTQFVPQLGLMRIDWEQIGQQALNGIAGALPGILIGAISIFGKREAVDARVNLNDIIALANKFQIQQFIPQITQFLSGDKLQQLQNQFFSTIVAAAGNNWDLSTIAQTIQQLVIQFAPQLGLMRIDWEQVGQQALNGVVNALPGILIGALSIFGKREAVDARVNLNDIVALANKLQIQQFIPQITQFLNGDKLQQLQNQFFATIIAAAGNNWDLSTIAQTIQQLVTQFVPQLGLMRIDWEQVGQQALNGVVNALPGILIGALSIFGKRDLNVNYQQLLAQLPVDKLAQIVELIKNTDKSKVLGSLRKLLQKFFPAYQGRINFDDLASTVLNHLNTLLPTLSQSVFSTIFG
ncbi:hypothetical protein I4U23_030842 [Adineta vaga]|nr:hypothetical protein I4U23_030842 [Adineta vaga]